MENNINDNWREALAEQQLVHKRIAEILTTWQRRHEILEGGLYMAQEVDRACRLAYSFLVLVQQAKDETTRAQEAIKKQRPFARRIGRSIGLFRVTPEELYELVGTSQVLDTVSTEAVAVHRLLTAIFTNVSQVNTTLSDLARTNFLPIFALNSVVTGSSSYITSWPDFTLKLARFKRPSVPHG